MKARTKSQKNSYLGNYLPVLAFSNIGLSPNAKPPNRTFLYDSAAFLCSYFSQTIARSNYSAIPRFYGTVPTENFGEVVLGCFLVKRRSFM